MSKVLVLHYYELQGARYQRRKIAETANKLHG
jgi:hypothetical protein